MQIIDKKSCTFDGSGQLENTQKPRRENIHNAVVHSLAGAEGLEPSTNGFGDHYSTN